MLPAVAPPRCACPSCSPDPGLSGAAADASAALTKGWGSCVKGVCARGGWNSCTREALSQERVSISPLELLEAASAVHMEADLRE